MHEKRYNNVRPQLKTQLDAILHFIQKMDAEMVEQLLIDEVLDVEFDKTAFFVKLQNTFDEFIKFGDTELQQFDGFCNSEECNNYNCPGYSFAGNKSRNYISLIVELKDGRVSEIFECHFFHTVPESIKLQAKISLDHPDSPDSPF